MQAWGGFRSRGGFGPKMRPVLGHPPCGTADVSYRVGITLLSFPGGSKGSLIDDNYFHATCSTLVSALLKLISLPLYPTWLRGGEDEQTKYMIIYLLFP